MLAATSPSAIDMDLLDLDSICNDTKATDLNVGFIAEGRDPALRLREDVHIFSSAGIDLDIATLQNSCCGDTHPPFRACAPGIWVGVWYL